MKTDRAAPENSHGSKASAPAIWLGEMVRAPPATVAPSADRSCLPSRSGGTNLLQDARIQASIDAILTELQILVPVGAEVPYVPL